MSGDNEWDICGGLEGLKSMQEMAGTWALWPVPWDIPATHEADSRIPD